MNSLRQLSVRGGLTAVCILLGAAWPSPQAQSPAPADLRAALEGSWQLEEWHVDGKVLRPPQADGRWSNHDGVVLFMLHRADSAESTMGYGVYEMTADTWSYKYTRTQRMGGPLNGPFTIAVQPPAQMRSFKVQRAPGKVILEGGPNDRREYEGPFFTFFQNNQILRRWRRIGS